MLKKATQYNDIDKVAAHHDDNHVPLGARHFRNDRAAMRAMVGALGLEATSADRSVLDLLGHVREHAALTRDYIREKTLEGQLAATPREATTADGRRSSTRTWPSSPELCVTRAHPSPTSHRS